MSIHGPYDPAHGYGNPPPDLAQDDRRRKKTKLKKKKDSASYKLYRSIKWLLVKKGGLAQLMGEYDIDPKLLVNSTERGLLTKEAALYTLVLSPDRFDAAIHNVAATKFGARLIRSDVYVPANNEMGYVRYSISKGGTRRNGTSKNLKHPGRV